MGSLLSGAVSGLMIVFRSVSLLIRLLSAFLLPMIKKGSKKYLESFLKKNENILNHPEYKHINLFFLLLFNVVNYKYLYENQLPNLIDSISEQDEIHPCINTISRYGGRVDTNLPRLHWMPNADKTVWGKLH